MSDEPKVKVEKIEIQPGHGLKQGHDHAQTANTPSGPVSNPAAWPAKGSGSKRK